MSTTTNIITAFKQLFHGKGANSTDVSDSVDNLTELTIAVPIYSGANASFTNATFAYQADENLKLESAHLASTKAVTNTAADDVIITVVTNGVTVATYNSNSSADDLLAANAYTDLSVNATNSFVDVDEYCNVVVTAADAANNCPSGVVYLRFSRQ